MSKLAVLGYGTVGSGVVEVLRINHDSIARRAGEAIEVKYVLDLRDFPGDPVEEVLVHDIETILQDAEIDVVVETMGGVHPAYEFTKRALQAGKSVCTSNKELVAEHGVELWELAQTHAAQYLFEASCGGGIPIIHALQQSLSADQIDALYGILNGTTNYILTKMSDEGMGFAEALYEAQQNGYAERNPEADIEGQDACRKIAILSSLAYGSHIDYRDVHTEGITKIATEDIGYAKALQAKVKLIAGSERTGDRVRITVCPMLVGISSPLYAVDGVFNAVLVHGNMLGDVMFYGSGAGKLPTASAVVTDVVDCVKYRGKRLPAPQGGGALSVLPPEEAEGRFFLRLEGEATDRLAELREKFGTIEILTVPEIKGEFGILTGAQTESAFLAALEETEGIKNRFLRMATL